MKEMIDKLLKQQEEIVPQDEIHPNEHKNIEGASLRTWSISIYTCAGQLCIDYFNNKIGEDSPIKYPVE